MGRRGLPRLRNGSLCVVDVFPRERKGSFGLFLVFQARVVQHVFARWQQQQQPRSKQPAARQRRRTVGVHAQKRACGAQKAAWAACHTGKTMEQELPRATARSHTTAAGRRHGAVLALQRLRIDQAHEPGDDSGWFSRGPWVISMDQMADADGKPRLSEMRLNAQVQPRPLLPRAPAQSKAPAAAASSPAPPQTESERVARTRRNMHMFFSAMFPKDKPVPEELDPFAYQTMYWYVGIVDKLLMAHVNTPFLNKVVKSFIALCEAYSLAPTNMPRMRTKIQEQIRNVTVVIEEYVVARGENLEGE